MSKQPQKQRQKAKGGGHKTRRLSPTQRRSTGRAQRRDPSELLKKSPDEKLDLHEVYDGASHDLVQGLVVSRRGPVYMVRLGESAPPTVLEVPHGDEEKGEPNLGHEVVACIARGEGKAAVVGDLVYFIWEESDLASGLIIAVELRDNALVRADALGRAPQVLAANLDRIWVVTALYPPPKSGLIDRYLVAAHANQIEVGIILNKIDLFMDEEHVEELEDLLAPYRALELPILLLSAREHEGIDTLKEALKRGRSVFVGHSGVGKTSLLNALVPELDEAVNDVSDSTGKGQHTTTTSTLYTLESGGELIDSPGIRGFGLWEMPSEELKDHFVEFLPYASQCRFHNCVHLHEPECEVIAAVNRDEISIDRYDAYQRIYDDLLDLEG